MEEKNQATTVSPVRLLMRVFERGLRPWKLSLKCQALRSKRIAYPFAPCSTAFYPTRTTLCLCLLCFLLFKESCLVHINFQARETVNNIYKICFYFCQCR